MSMPRTMVALACALALAGCGLGGGDDADTSAAGTPPSPRREQAPRPNFVIVMTDDQDWRSVADMPNVQRLLARQGTTYENAFASLPLCCPSRATFLSGQYAHNHGVWSNKPPEGGYDAFRGEGDTLGVWLRRAGYRTAWIGKYLNGYGTESPRVPPGWSRWYALMGQSALLMYNYTVSSDGVPVERGGEPPDYQTDVLARQTARFIRDAPPDRPFFAVLAPLAPHDELDTIDVGDRDPRPAERHKGLLDGAEIELPEAADEDDVSDKPPHLQKPPLSTADRAELERADRARRESLLAVDEAVAELVRTLDEAGRLEETVFVFTSDNGYLLGEHGMRGKNSSAYRGSAGIPLIVRGPGFEPGATVRRVVGNVDLPATIAALAGAETTRELDGRSLLADGGEHRALLLEAKGYVAVRTRRYLYVEHDRGPRELYDLREDPHELSNVAGDPSYAEAQDELARALAKLRDCAGAACDVSAAGG